MGNRKGQKQYSKSIKEQIRKEYSEGASQSSLNKKYGISRYAIQSWCGLRSEVNLRKIAPLKKGRPTNRPEDLEKKVKLLEMENELLRNFLQELERK